MPHSDWCAGPRGSRSMFFRRRKSRSMVEVLVLSQATLNPKGAGGGSPCTGCDLGFGGPLRPSVQKGCSVSA